MPEQIAPLVGFLTLTSRLQALALEAKSAAEFIYSLNLDQDEDQVAFHLDQEAELAIDVLAQAGVTLHFENTTDSEDG